MRSSNAKVSTIDEYIDGFPPDVKARLEEMRSTIHRAAPKATPGGKPRAGRRAKGRSQAVDRVKRG